MQVKYSWGISFGASLLVCVSSFIVGSLAASQGAGSSREPALATSNALCLEIILDEYPDESIAFDFNQALPGTYAVLVSIPVLKHEAAAKNKGDLSKRLIFKDKTNRCMLFVAREGFNTLESLGFDSNAWELLDADTFIAYMQTEAPDSQRIDEVWLSKVDTFFLPNSPVKKYIFLIGHGMIDQSVAGIPLPRWRGFLDILVRINTRFLWLLSCYSGGKNILTMQESLKTEKELKRNAKKHLKGAIQKALPFIIVVSSVGDVTATVQEEHSTAELFNAVIKFFDQEHPPFYLMGRPMRTMAGDGRADVITLLDVINAYYQGFMPERVNLPSVYIPGAQFFRAVDIDHSLIITALALKRYRVAEGIKKLGQKLTSVLDERSRDKSIGRVKQLWAEHKKLQKSRAELGVAAEGKKTSIQKSYEKILV